MHSVGLPEATSNTLLLILIYVLYVYGLYQNVSLSLFPVFTV